MQDIDFQLLIDTAKAACNHAQAKYSNFMVGSALITENGKIYSGCNIESSSFGLTICAERVALVKALSEGDSGFKALVIYAKNKSYCPPCGACRQLLMDYTEDLDVILTNGSDYKIYKLADLLPFAFNKNHLQNK